MKVQIKKLSDKAVVPFYAKKGDAGLDLVATSKLVVDEADFGYVEYGAGIALAIPEGYVGLLYPRSSISNTGLFLANSVGVIDSGYKNEIKMRFKYIPGTKMYEIGERVGQLVIMPYPSIEFEEVNELEGKDRQGGFGSSGS